MQITVRDLMTGQPTTVGADDTIDETMRTLLRAEASEVYVTDDGNRLLGIVPDYELLKARLARMPGDEMIETIMIRALATVHPDSPVDALAPAFRESRHRSIAVCEAGRLVGQVQRRDILRLHETLQDLGLETPRAESPADIRTPRFMRTRQDSRADSMNR